MLSPLVEEADNMYDQLGYFSRKVNIIKWKFYKWKAQ